MPFLWLNAVLNLPEVLIAGVLARRLCGSALDLRRPRRLAWFAMSHEPLGCDIFEAEDGAEAVDMAAATAFDLILMDVRMPRMDGLAATRAIRAQAGASSASPILAVTADAMPEDAARCLAAGMNGHLAKPITHASLFAAIDAVMGDNDEAAVDETAAA